MLSMSVDRSFNAMLKDAMDEIINSLGGEALLSLDSASKPVVESIARAVGDMGVCKCQQPQVLCCRRNIAVTDYQ